MELSLIDYILKIIIDLILPYTLRFIPLLLSDVVVFIITMAIVYILGRMLELTKSNRIKNLFALISIIGCNYWIYLKI
jgi:hypothetical protein